MIIDEQVRSYFPPHLQPIPLNSQFKTPLFKWLCEHWQPLPEVLESWALNLNIQWDIRYVETSAALPFDLKDRYLKFIAIYYLPYDCSGTNLLEDLRILFSHVIIGLSPRIYHFEFGFLRRPEMTLPMPIHHRHASTCSLMTPDDTFQAKAHVLLSADACAKYLERRSLMTRRLVSLKQLVKDLEEDGEDPADLYLDPNDLVELDEEPEDEE